MILQLQSLGFDVVIRNPPLVEMEVYLYPLELSLWVRIFWIYITERFARYDFFVTTQIALLDCWDRHTEISTTIHDN